MEQKGTVFKRGVSEIFLIYLAALHGVRSSPVQGGATKNGCPGVSKRTFVIQRLPTPAGGYPLRDRRSTGTGMGTGWGR